MRFTLLWESRDGGPNFRTEFEPAAAGNVTPEEEMARFLEEAIDPLRIEARTTLGNEAIAVCIPKPDEEKEDGVAAVGVALKTLLRLLADVRMGTTDFLEAFPFGDEE